MCYHLCKQDTYPKIKEFRIVNKTISSGYLLRRHGGKCGLEQEILLNTPEGPVLRSPVLNSLHGLRFVGWTEMSAADSLCLLPYLYHSASQILKFQPHQLSSGVPGVRGTCSFSSKGLRLFLLVEYCSLSFTHQLHVYPSDCLTRSFPKETFLSFWTRSRLTFQVLRETCTSPLVSQHCCNDLTV